MNNKQIHTLLALLCAAAMVASPFVIFALELHGVFFICAIILFAFLALINQIALLMVMYTEKRERGNKIGLPYILFAIINTIFVGAASFYATIGFFVMWFELGPG